MVWSYCECKMPPAMKLIDLVYCNAGGGHRSAAAALDTVIREQGLPWQVRLVNLFEVLDPRDVFGKTTGMRPEQYYNARLARGWTLGLGQELKLLQTLIRLSHKTLTAQLQRHWRTTQPDMVVSLVPNFSRAMFQALAAALLDRAASGAALDLRNGQSGGAGSRRRLPRLPHS
jgi:hypothetical protein